MAESSNAAPRRMTQRAGAGANHKRGNSQLVEIARKGLKVVAGAAQKKARRHGRDIRVSR